MRLLLTPILAGLAMGTLVLAQEPRSPCVDMTYENRNQTDYGPLRIAKIQGTAKDEQSVAVPGVCIGVFTSTDHRLLVFTETDGAGYFEFKNLPRGEYRLVAKCAGFCSGNAKIRVGPGPRSKKRLSLQVRPVGLDGCSYFELKTGDHAQPDRR